MAQKHILVGYLNGSSHEDPARRSLVTEGPGIIPQLLEVHLELLKTWGRYAATQASSLETEDQIDRSTYRALTLVTSIASVSAQHTMKAAARLDDGMQHPNPNIRTLAVLLCMAEELPPGTCSQAIMRCFIHDEEYLPKLAASICMAVADPPERILKIADGVVSDWVNGYVVRTYPHLYRKVQSALRNEDERMRVMGIGMGAAYREIAFRPT